MKKYLYATLLLLLYYALIIPLNVVSTSNDYALEVSSDVWFTVDNHSYFHFSKTFYCNNITIDDRVNFYDIYANGYKMDYFWFNVSNGNATIENFFTGDVFTFTVNGSGSIVSFYLAGSRPPDLIVSDKGEIFRSTTSLLLLKSTEKTYYIDTSYRAIYIHLSTNYTFHRIDVSWQGGVPSSPAQTEKKTEKLVMNIIDIVSKEKIIEVLVRLENNVTISQDIMIKAYLKDLDNNTLSTTIKNIYLQPKENKTILIYLNKTKNLDKYIIKIDTYRGIKQIYSITKYYTPPQQPKIFPIITTLLSNPRNLAIILTPLTIYIIYIIYNYLKTKQTTYTKIRKTYTPRKHEWDVDIKTKKYEWDINIETKKHEWDIET